MTRAVCSIVVVDACGLYSRGLGLTCTLAVHFATEIRADASGGEVDVGMGYDCEEDDGARAFVPAYCAFLSLDFQGGRRCSLMKVRGRGSRCERGITTMLGCEEEGDGRGSGLVCHAR